MLANNIDLENDPMNYLSKLSTYDTKNNYYAGGGFFSDLPPEFIDYIFYNCNKSIFPISSEIVFTEKLSEDDPEMTPIHLSDHWGLYTIFSIENM